MEAAALLLFVAGIVAMDTSSGPQCLISEPVVSCTILGILFGNPEMGLKMGVLFQLLWLGYMPLGAVRLTDGNMGAFIAVASMLSASVLFGFGSDQLLAAEVPSMLYAVLVAHIGMLMTTGLRKLNRIRNDTVRAQLAGGETVSITSTQLKGIASSFIRGLLMAVFLIPAGILLIGFIRYIPPAALTALVFTSLLIWGTVAASAMIFFWLKGRKRNLILGSIGGFVWMLLFSL
ncbi:MAG: PTS sugar transporter subunit IIC [Candidatus Latescibacteria bacterium]|nr:PTS sugar transporter subunit IIC [Candidatus Latescibacterota bacterium]